ncbi:MAG TPA: sigma-70 family RNA polymerase sigma factor [Polyangiales bacterium]|nr:sigma-70 family RNA polymerase sigma factor [Polyangiales bacterium]
MTGAAPTVDSGHLDAEALFRAHAPFIGSFLHRLGIHATEVEDLLQEVFIVAHRKGGYLPGPATPRSWLAAIAVRVAQAGRRARHRREPAAGAVVDLLKATGADPAQRLDVRRSMERVQRALDGMPFEQRAAFVLFEIEGESCEEIARVLEVPLGTIYSRLHHARRRFASAYAAADSGGARSVTGDR